MILTCPNCETQYFADDSTIGESGRTVKCAACGGSWFVEPKHLDETVRRTPAAAHEIYREKVREQRRRKSRTAALVSWLVTAGVFFALGVAAIMYRNEVVKLWPEAGSIYKQIGFNVNRFGLDFEDIQRSRTFNDTVPVVTVAGKALNISRSTVDTPAVRVDLKDERGIIVATTYGRIRPDRLAAGDAGTFQVVVEQAPMESFEIELKFVDLADMPPRDEAPTPTAEDLMAPETETPAE
ncbi:MAG: MJ0042-type zinc finger domain-containing protein [Hyphomonas sp.]|uniref:MJ0042-type zinc finger domain-containing protein n=1 Tax=Hyphomonas sp. TaxID=87 RepID=UPI003265F0A7|tara:strand:+ start:501 stop:1217 length:717 start_codon:yes stop_codon:yes gene_type:complete